MSSIGTLPIYALLALVSWLADLPQSANVYGQALALVVVDTVLTFVTPALAYTTNDPSKALRMGVNMLRDGWPSTAWYAVIAPMAIVFLTYAHPQDPRAISWPWIAGSALAGLLNLAVKGATARFYLRRIDTGDDGAAFTDYLAPHSERGSAEEGLTPTA
ncbi:MAG: hypothetical protein QOG04_399 [Actinomycetota bacterium]|jgi:hypothetical protein|nr:hypothetical protein [Actinomycetota bacterium]